MKEERKTTSRASDKNSCFLLASLMHPTTVLAGVGHVLRGDDGAGPALIEAVRKECPCVCIDAGAAPENYLGAIVQHTPRDIVFADAVDMELAPGQWRVFHAQELVGTGFHTHSIPLGLLLAFLMAQTDALFYVLGIQPGNMAFGAPLSEEVRAAIEEIKQIACRLPG